MPNRIYRYLVCCVFLSLVLCACNPSAPAITETPTQASTPTPEPINTPTPTYTLTPTPSPTSTVTFTPTPTSSPTLTPTPIGGKTPYLAFIGRDGNNSYNLFVVNIYTGETISKTELTYVIPTWSTEPINHSGTYSISWSEDASKIIFNTGGYISNSLNLYDVQTQVLKKIIDLPPESGISQFVWPSENNSWVGYTLMYWLGGYRANVWFVDLSRDPIYPIAVTDQTRFRVYTNWTADGLKLWSIADTGLGFIINEFNPVNGNTKVISNAEDEIISSTTRHISPSGKWEFIKKNPVDQMHSLIIDRENENSVETDCLVLQRNIG